MDGSLDWLPIPVEGGEDYGYGRFFASIDAIVMGRNTFDTVLSFGEWLYADKPMWVLSSRELELPGFVPQIVTRWSGSLTALVEELTAHRVKKVYVDGGKTIQSFLQAGLLDEITITTIPVLIGQGIPLFGPLDADVQLELAESQAYEDGLVQNRYVVVKG
jgi:dihydrofolate reductase